MFKGLGNLGNIASMVGSLQELPEKMKELNERMKSETVSASSGCGKVNVSMSGTGHVQSVTIDDATRVAPNLSKRFKMRATPPVPRPSNCTPKQSVTWSTTWT